jgi:3-dehydroquinate dehydratase type I
MFCIPILSQNTEEALEKIALAEQIADILEIRLDAMDSFDLGKIVATASRPVLVTYRSKQEGGRGSADYGTRVRYLLRAAEVGADFVDVEFSMPLEFRKNLSQRRNTCQLIVSTHLLKGTPPQEKLEETLRRMAATGAGIVKIVTLAKAPEDNIRVLGLIPLAKNLGVRIIAFCMGDTGRISRIAGPLMGGYLTFASLETGEESASGQIPIREMKKIMDIISS